MGSLEKSEFGYATFYVFTKDISYIQRAVLKALSTGRMCAFSL